jgi:hypothetical protein
VAVAFSTATTAATLSLAGVEAVLAVHGPVAAGLKRHSRLLSAGGTLDRGALRVAAVATTASAPTLLVLFRLTARFAALGNRVAPFLEERLVFAGKREFLPTVATGQLHISTHKRPFAYSFTLRRQRADIFDGRFLGQL